MYLMKALSFRIEYRVSPSTRPVTWSPYGATFRGEEVTGFTVYQDRTSRCADTLLDQLNPFWGEAHLGQGLEKKTPFQVVQSLRNVNFNTGWALQPNLSFIRCARSWAKAMLSVMFRPLMKADFFLRMSLGRRGVSQPTNNRTIATNA